MMKPKKPPYDNDHTAEKEVTELTDYEMLRNLHSKIDKLVAAGVTASSPEFKTWKNQVERLISKHCGAESLELIQFKKIRFAPVMYSNVMVYDDSAEEFKNGLMTVKGMLECFFEEWEEDEIMDKNIDNKKIFIVHGHDEGLKYRIARMLDVIGLEPIILHEQASTSKTIIEKIEKYGSEASAAIVLITPDDVGNVKTEDEMKLRARQNVIFEAGFFMGLLGRERTLLILSDPSIEKPGDLDGVVYTESDADRQILKELKAMGFKFDANKLL